MLLDLAIWADGATVFAPWRADGSRDYVAGAMPASAVQGVLLDLEDVGWPDAAAFSADSRQRDCVELVVERRGALTRTSWDEVEHPDMDATQFSRAALADWALGRSRVCDILRCARPEATQEMSFVLVRGSFRGLSLKDGPRASWME